MRWVAQFCNLSLGHLMRIRPSVLWVLQMYLLNIVCSLWYNLKLSLGWVPCGLSIAEHFWIDVNVAFFDAQGVTSMLEAVAQQKVDRHLEWIWRLFVLLWQLWSRLWWVSSKIWTFWYLWGSHDEFPEGVWQRFSCISPGHKKKAISFLGVATGALDLKEQLRCWLLLTLSKLFNLFRFQLLNLQSRNVFFFFS